MKYIKTETIPLREVSPTDHPDTLCRDIMTEGVNKLPPLEKEEPTTFYW